MSRTWAHVLAAALVLGCAALPAAWPATAGAPGTARDPASEPTSPLIPGQNWIDHFDTYATGSQLHGQGGWQGWNGNPGAGALTSSTQALSPPNSVEDIGASDLVQTYSSYTTGVWVYTAWQYLTSPFSDTVLFDLYNEYPFPTVPDGTSTQLCFDGPAGLLHDDTDGSCNGATTLPLALDRWVEIRVVIDFTADTQAVYYDGALLYSAPWSTHLGPTGVVNLAAVSLTANGALSAVYYDDLSLSTLPFLDGFESGDSRAWHSTAH